MLTSNILKFVFVTLACSAMAAQAAPDLTCRAGKEPGLSYHGDRVKLPPLAQRRILGTWLHTDNHLAVSLEAVGNAVYEVLRSQYCRSGSYGRRLNASPGGMYPLGRGEYYRIEPNGDLGVYDGDGRFDVYTRRTKVFAD
jgi:hypothetical protein